MLQLFDHGFQGIRIHGRRILQRKFQTEPFIFFHAQLVERQKLQLFKVGIAFRLGFDAAQMVHTIGQTGHNHMPNPQRHVFHRGQLQETLNLVEIRATVLEIIRFSEEFQVAQNQIRVREHHGVDQYFETLTMSSVCGIRKPRPEIFEIALNEMRIGKEQAAYVGDTISRDVRGVRNAGWPLMIQIDNPRIYHKDEKYRGMGYEPDVKIGSLPEVVTAVEQYNRNLKEGQN